MPGIGATARLFPGTCFLTSLGPCKCQVKLLPDFAHPEADMWMSSTVGETHKATLTLARPSSQERTEAAGGVRSEPRCTGIGPRCENRLRSGLDEQPSAGLASPIKAVGPTASVAAARPPSRPRPGGPPRAAGDLRSLSPFPAAPGGPVAA
jgi:hypothetical protein